MGGRRIFSPKYAFHYVIGTAVLALFFLIEFVASAVGHSPVVCYHYGTCMTLRGGNARFINWWFGVAFVLAMAMFFRNLYLWRLAVRKTSS